MESVKNASPVIGVKDKKINCHDCGKEIEVLGDCLKNGVILTYDDAGSRVEVAKCKACFVKSKSLANFRKCEVYSRVVGYIRPVGQWNVGKKQEYKERKEFKAEK